MEMFDGGLGPEVGAVGQLFLGVPFVKILCVHSYPEGRRAGGPPSSLYIIQPTLLHATEINNA